jgi:hypothetical protein
MPPKPQCPNLLDCLKVHCSHAHCFETAQASFLLLNICAGAPRSSLVSPDRTLPLQECLVSPNNQLYRLCHQGDANIVLYTGSTPLWASNTVNRATPGRFVIQGDGNLVAYSNTGWPYWASGTSGQGSGPYTAVMQPDGNFVLYEAGGRPLWSTGTAQASKWLARLWYRV